MLELNVNNVRTYSELMDKVDIFITESQGNLDTMDLFDPEYKRISTRIYNLLDLQGMLLETASDAKRNIFNEILPDDLKEAINEYLCML